MDFQNRVGSKPGSGGVASESQSNVDRRERLRKLALETVDLAKDPYFMKNHLGTYECKLCLTLHNNEGNYLAHTQGYKVTKQRDPDSSARILLFQIAYPEIADKLQPRHRFMSAFEQKVEVPDKNWQYLLFACEPYETVAFKIPNVDIDKSEGKFFSNWDKDGKTFTLQLTFAVGDAVKKQPAPPPPRPQLRYL
ncbi:splicing factor 3a subunit 2 [Plasmopara halstedii]|uniref:Splicing factor 3a subunit 2 n=1 Tax=Plasmopara halstedii TaxID=4781 RepID=A0A0P1ABS7_PLAHL|nr:splicing factor 3a subunit 2 [Plasmopara halstedii]CEG37642.1 splicing factor 3a subunit 2 [Plasmopara halstedii]|eukprot:XP_024574011.1 splicing factor 3a subunit 2 [Plasmopara halstedii]